MDSLELPEEDNQLEDSLVEVEDSQVLLEEGSRLGDKRLLEGDSQLEGIPQVDKHLREVGSLQEEQDSQQEHQGKALDKREADMRLGAGSRDKLPEAVDTLDRQDSLLEEPQLQEPSHPTPPPSPEYQDGVPLRLCLCTSAAPSPQNDSECQA